MAQTKMVWGGGKAEATLDGHFDVYPTESLLEKAMDGEYEVTIETTDGRKVRDYLSYTTNGVYLVCDTTIAIYQKETTLYAVADGVARIELHDV